MTFIKQSVDSCRRLPTATAPSYAHASPTARAVFPTPFPRGTRSCPRSAYETTGRGRVRDQDAVPDVTRSKPTLVATNARAATGDAHRRVELDHDRSTRAAMVRAETSPPAPPYVAQLDRSTAFWRVVELRVPSSTTPMAPQVTSLLFVALDRFMRVSSSARTCCRTCLPWTPPQSSWVSPRPHRSGSDRLASPG